MSLISLKHFAVRRALPVLLSAARAVTPARPHVFVTGYPAEEGNAVETVRALHQAYAGKIVWAQAPPRSYLNAIGMPRDPRIQLVRKGSPLALWKYVTAQAVFVTHGIYGDPPTSQRKPIINLWHGGGFKPHTKLFAGRHFSKPASSYIVAGARMWGGFLAEDSGLASDQVLLSGLPRCDQLDHPTDATSLRTLGIDPDRPFVVWMPSYRSARATGTMNAFSDTGSSDIDRSLAQMLSQGVATLADLGVQTAVKPHPFDAVTRDVDGAILIDDHQLNERSIPLYQLLGAADGLITDVSSVMSDYLTLGRPIGFFFPDRDDYRRTRGIQPADALDWLPGPLLDTPEDFAAFAKDILNGGKAFAEQRHVAADRMGLVGRSSESPAARLLRLLKQKDSSAFAGSIELD